MSPQPAHLGQGIPFTSVLATPSSWEPASILLPKSIILKMVTSTACCDHCQVKSQSKLLVSVVIPVVSDWKKRTHVIKSEMTPVKSGILNQKRARPRSMSHSLSCGDG